MKDELLRRLESFEIDKPGVAFPFSARLARENGWSPAYSKRVVREYLRFVWLAMRAGHPVTPSGAVDEAWHLHLCYTRSYWDEMCGSLLEKPLHHGPTEGGKAEDAKFVDWYGRTLESYRHHFGEEPPADIWPSPAERFHRRESRVVDPGTHWILSKRTAFRWLAGAAGVALVPVLAGCTPLLADIEVSGFFCVAMVLLGSFVLIKMVVAAGGGGAKKDKDKDSGGCGGGCSSISGCGSSSSNSDGNSSSGSGCSSSGCGSSGCGSSGCGGGGCGGGS